MVLPPVSLRLRIFDIRWCPPVCLIPDLVVSRVQGRLDSLRLEIAEGVLSFYTHPIFSSTKPRRSGCLTHTCHGWVLQESTSMGVHRPFALNYLVCGTDGHLVDLRCVNSPLKILFATNQCHSVGRLIFIAQTFVDNHREVEHTFINHTHLTTGHYRRPAKHANEDYPFILQDGDHPLTLLDDDIPSILSNNCCFADVSTRRRVRLISCIIERCWYKAPS